MSRGDREVKVNPLKQSWNRLVPLQTVIDLVDDVVTGPGGPVAAGVGHDAGDWHLGDVVRTLEDRPDETGGGVPGQMAVAGEQSQHKR